MDEEIDPSEISLLKKSGGRALGFMPDNGEGLVEVWRVDDKQQTKVEGAKVGIFFGGKSYIVKYRHERSGYIIYYWQVSCNW